MLFRALKSSSCGKHCVKHFNTQVINCYAVEVGVPDTGVSGHKQGGHCSPVDTILAMKVVECHDDLRIPRLDCRNGVLF